MNVLLFNFRMYGSVFFPTGFYDFYQYDLEKQKKIETPRK